MHLLSLTSLCQSVDEKETENKKETVISEGKHFNFLKLRVSSLISTDLKFFHISWTGTYRKPAKYL